MARMARRIACEMLALLSELKPTTRLDYVLHGLLVFLLLLLLCFKLCNPREDEESVAVITNPSQKISKVEVADACAENRATCVRNVLLISGDITQSTIDQLRQFTDEVVAKQFEMVCFNSLGGYVNTAVEIFDWIKTHQLKTCIAERYEITAKKIHITQVWCASACTEILLAGHSRLAIGSSFEYAVHNSGINFSLCFCEFPIDLGFILRGKMKDRLDVASNLNRKEHLQLLEKSQSVDYTDIYLLTWQDIQRYGVFTEYF